MHIEIVGSVILFNLLFIYFYIVIGHLLLL